MSPDCHPEPEPEDAPRPSGADQKFGDQQFRKWPDDFLRYPVLAQRRQRIRNFAGETHVLIGKGIGLAEQDASQ